MLEQEQVYDIIVEAISTVMASNDIILEREIMKDSQFISDLGFNSLMLAQLIMLVQEKIDYEPFINDYAISDIVTVADLIRAYAKQ